MANTGATIATSISGIPEVGSEITIESKFCGTFTRRRVLIGWRHQNDTPDALDDGKLWCWVNRLNWLMIYDQSYNRFPNPGVVKFCGLANFTMIRMFHPWWCDGGVVPQDMVKEDKAGCRAKWRKRMREFCEVYGPSKLPEPERFPRSADANVNQTQGEPSSRDQGRGRGHGRYSGRGGRRPPRRRAARRRSDEAVVTGRGMSVPGAGADEPMEITDDSENNDSDNDVDTDTDGTSDSESGDDEHQPPVGQPRVERPAIRAIREESTERILSALRRSDGEAKTEETAPITTIESTNNVNHQESDSASENDDSAVKNEEGQTGTGEMGDPIVFEEESDDTEMFFPEVKSDSVSGLSPMRDFEVQIRGEEADRMMDDLESFQDYEDKKDLELEEIKVAQTMEGPREIIVIGDDGGD